MSEISSPHQKTSKEGADVREIRHNERRNTRPTSNADNRVVIVIDDTPPGSPIHESSQAKEDRGTRTKEIQLTTNIGKGKSNTSDYKNSDKASRKVTVSAEDKATKKQSNNDDKAIKPRQSISPVARQIGAHGCNTSPPRNHNTDTRVDYRADNRDRFSCRSPSLRRYRSRSPSALYRRSPSPYNMNRLASSSYIPDYSLYYRYQDRSPPPNYYHSSRSISPIYRRSSRSSSPLYYQQQNDAAFYYRYDRSPPSRYRSRSPSIPYRRPRSSDSPPSGYTRPRLPSPFYTHRLPSPTHHGCSTSPTYRGRSRSPLRRGRSRSPPRRGRSRSPLRRGRSRSPLRRDHLPSPRRSNRLSSPRRLSRSPPRRSRSRSKQERKPKLSEKQDQQRSATKHTTKKHIGEASIILVSDSPPTTPVSNQKPSIPAPQAESSMPPPRMPASNTEPVMPTPQPESNRSSSAMRHSAYDRFTPNYISIIKSMDALPIKVMENFGHMNKTLPAGQDTIHFEAKEGGQTGMTDNTLIETDRDDNVIGKDMSAMRENTPEAVELPTPIATESSKPVLTKTTNPAVADEILPVVLYTPKPVVSMFSYLQNHTDSRNKGYGNEPSLKNNEINSGSGKVPIASASVQSVEKDSASDSLGGTRRKVARLLPPWKVKMSDEGDIYYYNPITGATSETRPA
ncbi:uncharacterized protein EV154DRAFT_522560 [Mucor mucedo]|uniref:uncharacterized protein n=1 Tax=Mucor mucedo TaxID=29922 RepID=UPI00221FF17D|nr:uncharacterized protein EV154DRAFT_522560 [Mucor mucedo]KAI7883837.1 hypothetical protein EV154DRAFT_522560 [Mucor mucedo]